MNCVEFFCLLSIRGVMAPAMLVQLFRLSRDRIRLKVSSRLVTAQQADLHKRFVFLVEGLLALFLVLFLRHKVPFAIDALSDF